MNLLELQKLDFLLKKVNEFNESQNHRIVVGFNGQTYIADFIPEIANIESTFERSIKIKDVTYDNNDKYNYISLSDTSNWFDIFDNKKANIFYSPIQLLINKSKILNAQEYFVLLVKIIKKYPFTFDEELSPYLYNIDNLTTKSPITFMKVKEYIEFDFISLISINND